MTEEEKAAAGLLYNAALDQALKAKRLACKQLCFELNRLAPANTAGRRLLLGQIFGGIRGNIEVLSPFWCDYGYNITVGENFFANHGCVILDTARITFGDNVFIAPNCCFSAASHPLDAAVRSAGLETAAPITVGNSVWFGASVTVLPGVSIGDNTVIGAGSVVTRDIPANSLAFGNPCTVKREITAENKSS